VAEGCVEGSDTEILETRLTICSKTEKMKGQGLGGRGLIVEITGKCHAGSPRFTLLYHCPHPGNESGLVPHPCGAALGGWCGGIFTGLPLNVQLQPDCIKNSLLRGGWRGCGPDWL